MKTLPFERSIFRLFRDFIPHVTARRRLHLSILIVLMFLGAVAELVTIGAVIPFISLMAEPETAFRFPLLQNLFGALGWNKPEEIVIPMTVLFLVIILMSAGIRLLLLWVNTRFIFALGYDIGVAIYNRTLTQPYSFHIAKNSSETIAAVNKVQAVMNAAIKPLLDGMIALVTSVGIIGVLIYVQPVAMTVAVTVFTLAYGVIAGLTRIRIKSNGKQIAHAHTQRVRCVQEGLGGIRDIILDNSQAQSTRTFSRVDNRLRKAQASNAFFNQAPRYLIEVIGVFLIVGVASLLSAKEGGLIGALPVLAALALGAQRLLPMIQRIYSAWVRMTGSHQMFAEIVELLELPGFKRPDECKNINNNSVSPIKFEREILLKNAGFRYAGSNEPVLAGIDLRIKKGSCIGIVGPTGGGKSTLVDLLMGLLEPTEGHLSVDGVTIDASNRRAWQRHISHVPQHIFLADVTVEENIAIGVERSEIDLNRVEAAARSAGIADYIEVGPMGYQAIVGERGIQLSGGQRQRLGIARALYRESGLLVLDEATSALDNITEDQVMRNLSECAASITVVMIAHRIQTLARCDEIIHLEGGTIKRIGTFNELVEDHAATDIVQS